MPSSLLAGILHAEICKNTHRVTLIAAWTDCGGRHLTVTSGGRKGSVESTRKNANISVKFWFDGAAFLKQ